MTFYHYDQNNSGGHTDFNAEAGISSHVWIEAASPEEANERALAIGIYFDGTDTETDCSCCGDRWSRASEWDAVKTFDEVLAWAEEGAFVLLGLEHEAYVHRADGAIVPVSVEEKP